MADSEYNPGNYKSLKINIGAIIKNLEILRFVPVHLKTKKMCKYADKKLPFVIRYVPDRCKAQDMCDKVILEKGGILQAVPDCSKN